MTQRFGIVTITKGMINHNYLSVTPVLDLFPNSAMGGSSCSKRGSLLEIYDGTEEPISTDIDGVKGILRNRRWTRIFFERYRLEPGDKVRIEETGPSRYRVYP